MENGPERDTVRLRFEELWANRGRVRLFDAATHLGVSELDVVDAFPDSTVPLEANVNAIFTALGNLGPLVALTRNQSAVIECHGVYSPFAYSQQQSLVLGEEIDLRLSLTEFAFVRAVPSSNPFRLPGGVLFFDAWGRAVHKAYFTQNTAPIAFDLLTRRFGTGWESCVRTVRAGAGRPPTSIGHLARSVSVEERTRLQEAWAQMRDTHEVFGLLDRFRLARLQALRLLGPKWAKRARGDALWNLLVNVAAGSVPVMIFVGNKAVIQIYKGRIERPVRTGPCWNVLDGRWNLHVDSRSLGETWIVRKPIPEGVVTSVEVFDRQEQLVVQVFPRRRAGQPEPAGWAEFLDSVLTA